MYKRQKWNNSTNYNNNLNIKEFNIIDSNENYITPSLDVTQTQSVYDSTSTNVMLINTGDYVHWFFGNSTTFSDYELLGLTDENETTQFLKIRDDNSDGHTVDRSTNNYCLFNVKIKHTSSSISDLVIVYGSAISDGNIRIYENNGTLSSLNGIITDSQLSNLTHSSETAIDSNGDFTWFSNGSNVPRKYNLSISQTASPSGSSSTETTTGNFPPTDGTMFINSNTNTLAIFTISGATTGANGTYIVNGDEGHGTNTKIAPNLFDNDTSTRFVVSRPNNGIMDFTIELPVAIKATGYTVTMRPNDQDIYTADDIKLYGSTDGTNYTLLDQSDPGLVSGSVEEATISFTNTNAYKYYKVEADSPDNRQHSYIVISGFYLIA